MVTVHHTFSLRNSCLTALVQSPVSILLATGCQSWLRLSCPVQAGQSHTLDCDRMPNMASSHTVTDTAGLAAQDTFCRVTHYGHTCRCSVNKNLRAGPYPHSITRAHNSELQQTNAQQDSTRQARTHTYM